MWTCGQKHVLHEHFAITSNILDCLTVVNLDVQYVGSKAVIVDCEKF